VALSGTIVTTTSGNAVLFSSGDATFRARSVYFYGLTAGNSLLLDLTATSGNSTGFSVVASTAAGSATLSFLASR
jgi:hypothetical protein